MGDGGDAAPPSITTDDDVPRPLRDALGDGSGVATASGGDHRPALVDDNSGTEVALDGAHPWIQYRFAGDAKQLVRFYTLTSGTGDRGADPQRLGREGLERRQLLEGARRAHGQTFPWRSQTRAFKLARPGNYVYYRIEVTENGGAARRRSPRSSCSTTTSRRRSR